MKPLWLEVSFNLPLHQSFTYVLKEPEERAYVGCRVEVFLGNRKTSGFVVAAKWELPPDFPLKPEDIKEVRRVIDREPIFGEGEIELAQWMASFYLCSAGEALSAMIPSGRRESESQGIAEDEADFSPLRTDLSDEQKTAVEGIVASGAGASSGNGTSGGASSSDGAIYLYGVTGSGKTEVFLQAAERVLDSGKDVIYLVPEIALTHQVEEAITRRFGALAAVLHSGLSPSRRLTEWMRVRRGEARIVVGARSAVFAPVANLGLIIIDEEHDSSYKSGTSPRYHARQLAMRRCALASCPLVMGSATPSLEAWHQIQTGSMRCYRLTKRLSGGAPPAIKIVSLAGSTRAISGELLEEMREAKRAGKQSIIFLNRRGFTHFFRCNTCGYELLCRNCSVPVTWHRSQGVMKCHYCGWQSKPPASCPECGSLDVGYAGFGTEYLEEEIANAFPDCSIQRVDTDSLTGKDSLKNALADFREGKTDILLGTQMVAKGLNFPGVRLVGIALADTGLHMPDFRASERTFALIMQVAGRAGRFFPDGRVLVQTWNPNNPVIRFAQTGDIEGFYAYELAQRAELGFPPFSRLVRLVFRSKQSTQAETGAAGAAKILRELLRAPSEVMGPAECPISLMSGNHRHQVILKGPRLAPLVAAARAFRDDYKPNPALYVEYDVDPQSLL